MPVIEVEQLSRTFRTYRKQHGLWGSVKGLFSRHYDLTHAASDVTFTVEEGELVGFLGPNGAGKTTTLKMLSGLLNPTGGRARVLGYVPWERQNDFKRRFALVMGQKNALWWDLPAAESLELSRVIYGVPTDRCAKTIDELTTLLDVKDKLGVMVRELSLGERMKFELINALLHEPQVLFLDEPTIGLDVTSQQKVRDFLKFYTHHRKITTLLTSHYMQDIQELCRRVIIIDHGRIFYNGALKDVVEKFADHKIVTLVSEQPLPEGGIGALGEVLESGGQKLKIKVPRTRISEVCRELLLKFPVADISITEVPVEDVIREIFARNRPVTDAA